MKNMSIFTKIRYIGVAIALIYIILIIIISLIYPGENIDDVPRPDLDNFLIADLQEEQIIKIPNCQESYSTRWQGIGEVSGIPNIAYKKEDHSKTTFSAKRITGIKTVSATLAEDCVLHMVIRCKVADGNAKIVVVMDDTILEYLDVDENISIKYDVDGQHEFYVKILCESAEIELSVERSFEELKTSE